MLVLNVHITRIYTCCPFCRNLCILLHGHGVGDNGIGDHGIGDHGVGDHGIGDQDIGDHDIGDHGVGDHDIGDNISLTVGIGLPCIRQVRWASLFSPE